MQNTILKIDEKSQIVGHIYKIVNKLNNKIYVGQAMSHRLNKGKYRPFGYKGRFKDHLSEAKNNTKLGCPYLNSAIRKDGYDNFTVELIETCEYSHIDEREIFYIKLLNSLYPTGYNLSTGGKRTLFVKNELEKQKLLEPSNRGRPLGYTHKEESKEKMKQSLKNISEHLKSMASTEESKSRVSKNIKKYYYESNLEKLSKHDLSNDLESYIKPIVNKKTGLPNIQIYIDRCHRYYKTLSMPTLEEKFNFLKEILHKAKNLKGENS